MKATNNKKAKQYIKPEINCYTIGNLYPVMSSGEYYEKIPPSEESEELYDGELD